LIQGLILIIIVTSITLLVNVLVELGCNASSISKKARGKGNEFSMHEEVLIDVLS